MRSERRRRRAHEFTISSALDASPPEVWQRVSTMAGVNDELRPILKMTHPDWVARVEVGRGFLERSRMLSQRVWEHERTLERVDGEAHRCCLTDRVRFEPRLPFGGTVMLAIVRLVFHHCHRRLREAFCLTGP